MSEAVTILEGFGEEAGGFVCDACSETRRYYDRLSNGNMECLECSTKAGYALDVQGTYHSRSSELLATDPELQAVSKSIVEWKIDTEPVSEIKFKITTEVLEQLESMAIKTGSTVEVLINAGVSLILNNHKE